MVWGWPHEPQGSDSRRRLDGRGGRCRGARCARKGAVVAVHPCSVGPVFHGGPDPGSGDADVAQVGGWKPHTPTIGDYYKCNEVVECRVCPSWLCGCESDEEQAASGLGGTAGGVRTRVNSLGDPTFVAVSNGGTCHATKVGRCTPPYGGGGKSSGRDCANGNAPYRSEGRQWCRTMWYERRSCTVHWSTNGFAWHVGWTQPRTKPHGPPSTQYYWRREGRW